MLSDQFVGEIRMFGFGWVPNDDSSWIPCNGQLLQIRNNAALFSLFSTNFGGDGKTTFGIPNLNGLVPIQAGQGNGLTNRPLGSIGGETTVNISSLQMPSHNHAAQGVISNDNPNASPAGNVWGIATGRNTSYYSPSPGAAPPMNVNALQPACGGDAQGNALPHNNMPPFLALNFCVAVNGIFPSRP